MKLKLIPIIALFCVVQAFAQSGHQAVDAPHPKIWSILICTLDEREESFNKIYTKLCHQIVENKLDGQIEIVFFKDNREHSIGYKRNALINQSDGEYVCFVDDDDDVHDRYIVMIYEQLMQKPDCVSLTGIMTTNGKNPETFIHSIHNNNKYCTVNGVHLRPPNHLNPIKRSIACQFSYPESNFGEDRMWALELAQSGLLKVEATILEPYYFYQYDGKYHVQSKQTQKPVDAKKPRVSIITSVYKGDEFIEGFLSDIVRQTIFKECELIIINANSPGNEEPIIKRYAEQYENIVYERLASDPGLYGVWNYGIKKAKAELITNANIDDRRNPQSLEMHARALDEDPSVGLVYSNYYRSYRVNQTFEDSSSCELVLSGEFSPPGMCKCLAGPQPMWRKSLHEAFGFFDESFASSGDFELWNRWASQGVVFKKVPGISGVYYQNPQGLSTDEDPVKLARRNHEDARIVQQYRHMWGW